ncbi:MAG: autotransporter assembly complex family protein [Salinisphaeraceae bacterium]
MALLALCGPVRADEVSVTLEGIEGELADNARAFLTIDDKPTRERDEARVRRLHRLASGEIRQALQPFGYYQPEIEAKLTRADEQWRARYQVDPGPATKVTSLELDAVGEGADLPAVQEVLADSELGTGKQLDHRHYEATKSALLSAAYDAGYLDAGYRTATIRVQPEQAEAEIELVLDTGPRYYFGPIKIEQDILDPAFAQRYVPFESGTPFNAERLIDLQLALGDTDYFDQVQIEARRDELLDEPGIDPAPQVPVRVSTEPRKPRRYSASVGYGTDTGARLGLGAEFRRLNRRGHQLRTDLRLSEIKQSLSARYDIPIDNVLEDRLSFGATATQEEIGDVRTDQFRLSASREDGWAKGRRRLYLNLERESFDLGNGRRSSDLLYPGATLSLKQADDLLRPRQGISLSLDVHGGTEALVSATDFIQGHLTAALVVPIGDRARLLTRGELAGTQTSDFDALPPSQRFYAGGDRSVRGYGYQEIGPKNAAGENTGGQYLAIASIEAEYLFYQQFGAAVFFDAGDASPTTGFDLKRGVGMGFRWLSPIGTLRIDFAHPLDDPDSDFSFHFSLGPDL